MENNETEKENIEKEISRLSKITEELTNRGTWNFILLGICIGNALFSSIFTGTIILPLCQIFIAGLIVANGFNIFRLMTTINQKK